MRARAALLAGAIFAVLLFSCGGEDEAEPTPTALPSPSPAASPVRGRPARETLGLFAGAVTEGRLDDAWSLHVASLDPAQANPGCDASVFAYEFQKLQHFFARAAPFIVRESFGLPDADTIELTLSGADGNGYLATFGKAGPEGSYFLAFLNSGVVARVPGAPDPLPSPEDPAGLCGIWTGPR